AEIAVELGHVGIDVGADRTASAAKMQHAGRRDGHLRGDAGSNMGRDEAEVIQHRVAGKAELADDAQTLGLGLDAAFELDAVLGLEALDAVEAFEEIEMPHGAAEL